MRLACLWCLLLNNQPFSTAPPSSASNTRSSISSSLSSLSTSYPSSASAPLPQTFDIRLTTVPMIRLISLDFTFHHFVTISEGSGAQVILDFVPVNRKDIPTLIGLLLGKSKPGKIRTVVLNKELMTMEMKNIVENITSAWNTELNIYDHNCQDFSNFVTSRIVGNISVQQNRLRTTYRHGYQCIILPLFVARLVASRAFSFVDCGLWLRSVA